MNVARKGALRPTCEQKLPAKRVDAQEHNYGATTDTVNALNDKKMRRWARKSASRAVRSVASRAIHYQRTAAICVAKNVKPSTWYLGHRRAQSI